MIGFCAFSGTGKTTLLAKIIPLLKQKGVRLALIKHGHHHIDIDTPGKDSYIYRKAGADQIVLASKDRVAVMHERNAQEEEPSLHEIIAYVKPDQADLILVEGFKYEAYPKIELYRPSLNKEMLFPNDHHIIAVATDNPIERFQQIVAHRESKPTLLDLNSPVQIAHFILAFYTKHPMTTNNQSMTISQKK